MPRQLPWKTGTALQSAARPVATASPASASQSPAPPHRSTGAQPVARTTPDQSARATPKPRRSLALGSGRSPSTSPPPEPLKEEFMIEGLDRDDKYRMVEDEFLAVAGDFTKHLHAAEYQRLKNLAKSQNAETIQNISRPVTGEMTELVKRRHAALGTAARQRKGIANALGKRPGRAASDTDNDDFLPGRAATSLRGLMDSPRKKAVPLAAIAGGSRAAAAGHQDPPDISPSRRSALRRAITQEPGLDADSDTDDDLDSQTPWPEMPQRRHPPARTDAPLPQQSAATRLPSRQDHQQPLKAETSSASHEDAAQPALLDKEADTNDDDFFSSMRTRKEEQRRKRESIRSKIKTETQTTSLNDIPFN